MSVRRLAFISMAVVTLAVAGAAQDVRPWPPPAPPMLQGRVVDATTGSGIGRAIVTIAPQQGSGAALGVETDASGRFSVLSLRPGPYAVTAKAPGYAPGAFGTSRIGAVPDDAFGVPAIDVVYYPVRTDVIVALSKLAAIDGFLKGDNNEPLAGVQVSLGRWKNVGDERRVELDDALAVTTSAAGRFMIPNLIPAEYVLLIGSRRASTSVPGKVRVFPEMYYSNSPTARRSQPIVLKPGELRRLNIESTAEPTVTVSGRVVGPPDAIAGLPLVLSLPAYLCERTSRCEAARGLTDGKGRFTIAGVLPGHYEFGAAPMQSMRSVPGSTALAGITFAPTRWIDEPIEVEFKDIDGIELPLRTGATLSGSVIFEGAPAPSDSARSRMAVSIEPVDQRKWPGMRSSVSIQRDGTFKSTGIPRDRYLVRLGNLPAGWWLKEVRLVGVDVSIEPFDFYQDAPGALIILTAKPSELSGAASTKEGVSDELGAVIAFSTNRLHWRNGDLAPRDTRYARVVNGAYAIRGLPEGEYFVCSIADADLERWQDPAFLAQLVPRASRVKILDGARTIRHLTR